MGASSLAMMWARPAFGVRCPRTSTLSSMVTRHAEERAHGVAGPAARVEPSRGGERVVAEIEGDRVQPRVHLTQPADLGVGPPRGTARARVAAASRSRSIGTRDGWPFSAGSA
jgi:hypothetical protein